MQGPTSSTMIEEWTEFTLSYMIPMPWVSGGPSHGSVEDP